MGITAIITPVTDVSEKYVCEMLRLMQVYYSNVSPVQFVRDLKEKDWVIILEEDGCICGFSTQMLFDHDVYGHWIKVIYSGDTVIDKSHWRSLALPVAWGRLVISIITEFPNHELYWLLTSKGYKTYRFLPVFFQEFYPSYMKEAPVFEKALLCSLGKRKFGNRFDPESCVIRASNGAQCLWPGVADITEARRNNKDIAFFEKTNPGYAKGDELVCIARCHEENINPFIMRRLRS